MSEYRYTEGESTLLGVLVFYKKKGGGVRSVDS